MSILRSNHARSRGFALRFLAAALAGVVCVGLVASPATAQPPPAALHSATAGDPADEPPAPVGSSTVLSLSSPTLKVDEILTVDVTVAGDAPTGTVVLSDDGQEILSDQLVDGSVSFSTNTLAAGTHPLTATYQGDAGNTASASDPVDAVVTRWETTVVLSPPTAVTWGNESMVGVRVLGDGPTPGGVVHLLAGSLDLGTQTLDTDSAATFTVPGGGLPVGASQMSATYDGDEANAVAGVTGTLDVSPRPSITTVSVAPASIRAGTRATATVSVKVNSAPASGVVTIGGPTTASLNLVGGQAKFLLPAFPAGHTYAVTATYAGSATNGRSSAQAGLTVTKIPTTVRATAAKVGYGDPSRVAVTIAGAPLAVGGTASIVYKGRVVAVAGVVNGRATLVIPATWGSGTRLVAVVYAGDGTHTGSWAPVSIVRVKSTPAFSVTARNAAYGTSTSATVTVGRHGSGAVPTGVVTVRQGKTAVAVARLSAGRVVVRMPASWTPGTRALTVTYSGDTGYSSRAAAFRVVTTKATPKMVIGAIATVTNLGHTRIPVTVRGVSAAATGTVTVTYGTVIGKGTLRAGATTIVLAPRRAGNYRVTVSYSGSANYVGRSVVAAFAVAQEPRGAKTFGDGTFRVGVDIRAGLYRVKVPAGNLCYWARDKDNSGTLDGIIANELETGYGLIRILPSDRFVESTRCGTWHLVSETSSWPFYNKSIPGDGAFLIGKDIAPGLYHQTRAGCYYELLTDVTGGFDNIITNDYSGGASYLTVTNSAFALRTSGCSSWTKVG